MVAWERRYVLRRLGDVSVELLDTNEVQCVYLTDSDPSFVALTRSQLELLKRQVDAALDLP